jgi:hypothetical protein
MNTGPFLRSAHPSRRKCVPSAIRCDWERTAPGTYTCRRCREWTANLPEYRDGVCPALDRRKGTADRREA